MNKNLLITFGCSWMAGVGLAYEPGMTIDQYYRVQHRREYEDQYSFRSIIARNLNLDNKNFSQGASSNQRQFRFAKNFFLSDYFKQAQNKYNNIIVLWGITSVYRGELFSSELNRYKNFLLSDSQHEGDSDRILWPFPKDILTCSFDYQAELQNLYVEMCYFNEFFKSQKIKNIWVDLFGHHDYVATVPESNIESKYNATKNHTWPSWEEFIKRLHLQGTEPANWNLAMDPTLADQIPPDAMQFEKDHSKEIKDARRAYVMHPASTALDNLLFANDRPRDLLSKLAKSSDDSYHMSEFKIDSEKVQVLVDQGILNPYSKHPTQLGSGLIAEMLEPHIKQLL